MTTEVHFRDFSRKRKPVRFAIDGVRYECVKALGLPKLQKLISAMRGIDVESGGDGDESTTEQVLTKFKGAMKIIMKPESFAKFSQIVEDEDAEEPIDHEQILDIVKWVVEIYGLRPTEQSSNSSDGSPSDDAGTSSTAGAELTESIPSILHSPASST